MDKVEIANSVKKAVEALNNELQKAADANLEVVISNLDATDLGDTCRKTSLSVEIFEKIIYSN